MPWLEPTTTFISVLPAGLNAFIRSRPTTPLGHNLLHIDLYILISRFICPRRYFQSYMWLYQVPRNDFHNQGQLSLLYCLLPRFISSFLKLQKGKWRRKTLLSAASCSSRSILSATFLLSCCICIVHQKIINRSIEKNSAWEYSEICNIIIIEFVNCQGNWVDLRVRDVQFDKMKQIVQTFGLYSRIQIEIAFEIETKLLYCLFLTLETNIYIKDLPMEKNKIKSDAVYEIANCHIFMAAYLFIQWQIWLKFGYLPFIIIIIILGGPSNKKKKLIIIVLTWLPLANEFFIN